MKTDGWTNPGLGIAISLLVFSVSLTAEARTPYMQKDHFGLGLLVGSPSAVSVKYMFDETSAIDGAVGWGFMGGNNLHVHADYAFHQRLKEHPYFDLSVTLGGGVRSVVWFKEGGVKYLSTVKHKEKGFFGLGVRVKAGLNFALRAVPVEIFLEMAPGIGFLPYVGGFIDGGLGARYFF